MTRYAVTIRTDEGALTLGDRYSMPQIHDLALLFSSEETDDGMFCFSGTDITRIVDWHASACPDRTPIGQFVSDYVSKSRSVTMFFEPVDEPELCVPAPY